MAKLDQTKSSVARGIRGKIAEQFPQLEDEEVLDELILKKCTMNIAKTDHRTSWWWTASPCSSSSATGPTSRNPKGSAQVPDCMPKLRRQGRHQVRVRAQHQCARFTFPGAVMHDDVPEDTPVAIYAEGRSTYMGITKMRPPTYGEKNKGIRVDTIHHLGDGLWMSDRSIETRYQLRKGRGS